MSIPLAPGVAPNIGWMLTPEQVAAGNDTCLINCPTPVRLCIDTEIYIDFPAGTQTWAIGCPAWNWMVANGASNVFAQNGNYGATFQNLPNWTLGPVLQRVLMTSGRSIIGPPLSLEFGEILSPIPTPPGMGLVSV